MPPELHIYVPPEAAARARTLITDQIPEARVVKEVALPSEIGTPETALAWEEERTNLEHLVACSRNAVEKGDPLVVEAYQNLHVAIRSKNRNIDVEADYQGKPETFAQDVLEIFERSLEVCRQLEKRPAVEYTSKNNLHVIAYREFRASYGSFYGPLLNPQQMRILTYNWELTGTTRNKLELQAMEGVLKIQSLIKDSEFCLMHSLLNLQSQRRRPL